MSSTAVILVNWNGWRDTLECLASLQGLQRAPLLTVVVDNRSADGSVQQLADWCAGRIVAEPQSRAAGLPVVAGQAPAGLRWAVLDEGEALPAPLPSIVILRSRLNRGFAGGNNLGLRLACQAGAQAYWLLNTDTVADAHALEALEARARSAPRAGMVGSTLLYYWRPGDVQALGGATLDMRRGAASHLGAGLASDAVPTDPADIEARTDYVVGASMFVTRPFVEAVGEMCEDYFLYFEEADWALRARGRFTLAWAPASRVFHKVGGSSRRTASRLSLRYLYRNRLRFVSRFFPESLPAARRHMLLQVLQHARRGHWNDVLELVGALARRGG